MTHGDDQTSFYGSSITDQYLLRDPASLPRYAHLARKALMHYAGDTYNPHLHGLAHEPFLRQMIHEIIAYKVLYRAKTYDWQWIDQSLSKYIGQCFNLNLPYSQHRIDAGFDTDSKAAILVDHQTAH